MSNGWPIVPLGEVMKHRKEFVEIDDLARYKRCRARLHAQGIVLRDELPGAEIKTKKQQVCRGGEFLVAEIDAKLGGYGIVPPDLDGAIVSSHYFLFDINTARITREFLGYYIRTSAFFDQVAAQGSTNYAAIRPSHVLAYTLPLPPLVEQKRIVAKLDSLAAKVTEARRLRSTSIAEAQAVWRSACRTTLGDEPTNDWQPLSAFVDHLQNGWSPQCRPEPAEPDEWGVLKVGAVSFGRFEPAENKALPMMLEPTPEYEIRAGDFLMSRANTTALVGACALVETTRPKLILCDKIFRFIFKPGVALDARYLNCVLKSPALRQQIERVASGTSSTMKNIAKDKVLALRIPSHGREAQQRIVAYLDGMQTKVDRLKEIQAQTAAELDALLPSILNNAFRGDL
jgi:type I restriction enzyme S subunit